MYKDGDVGKRVTAQNSNANVDYTPVHTIFCPTIDCDKMMQY
jgi:hypothetical protein